MLSSVKSTVFYVTSGDFLLLLKPACFIHTVQVITAVSCGTCRVVLWMISAYHRGRALEGFSNLPYQTHGYLLPLLCDCLPVHDELFLRFVNFVLSCMAYQSHLVSFIARYNTMHGRFSSPVGCNIQRC